MHVNAVVQQLDDCCAVAEVRRAIEFLVDHDRLYSTIDDDHGHSLADHFRFTQD